MKKLMAILLATLSINAVAKETITLAYSGDLATMPPTSIEPWLLKQTNYRTNTHFCLIPNPVQVAH